jgi:phosphopantetheinyl transferase
MPSLPALALAAPAPGVVLWLCNLDRASDQLDGMSLSAEEQARAARFGTDLLRRRWIAGRTVLRSLLAQILETDPASVRLRRGVRGRSSA